MEEKAKVLGVLLRFLLAGVVVQLGWNLPGAAGSKVYKYATTNLQIGGLPQHVPPHGTKCVDLLEKFVENANIKVTGEGLVLSTEEPVEPKEISEEANSCQILLTLESVQPTLLIQPRSDPNPQALTDVESLAVKRRKPPTPAQSVEPAEASSQPTEAVDLGEVEFDIFTLKKYVIRMVGAFLDAGVFDRNELQAPIARIGFPPLTQKPPRSNQRNYQQQQMRQQRFNPQQQQQQQRKSWLKQQQQQRNQEQQRGGNVNPWHKMWRTNQPQRRKPLVRVARTLVIRLLANPREFPRFYKQDQNVPAKDRWSKQEKVHWPPADSKATTTQGINLMLQGLSTTYEVGPAGEECIAITSSTVVPSTIAIRNEPYWFLRPDLSFELKFDNKPAEGCQIAVMFYFEQYGDRDSDAKLSTFSFEKRLLQFIAKRVDGGFFKHVGQAAYVTFDVPYTYKEVPKIATAIVMFLVHPSEYPFHLQYLAGDYQHIPVYKEMKGNTRHKIRESRQWNPTQKKAVNVPTKQKVPTTSQQPTDRN